MELGKRISMIRKGNNMTQEMFAEKYCVTQQTVSHWENGKSYPDLEILIKISDDFNVSLDELMKGDRKMVSQLSKMIKTGKSYKKAMIMLSATIAMIAVLASVRIGAYYLHNSKYEQQYRKGLETYGFERDESVSSVEERYITTIDGISYYVSELDLADINSPVKGDMSKDVTAVIDPDKTLVIDSGNKEEDVPYHIVLKIRDECFSIDVFEDDPENAETYVYEYDAKRHLAEYSGHLDDGIDAALMSIIMRQVYEDNKPVIDTAFVKAEEIRQTLY